LYNQYTVRGHRGLRAALVAIDTQHAPLAAAIRAGRDPNPLVTSTVPALSHGALWLLGGALLLVGFASIRGRRAGSPTACASLVFVASAFWSTASHAQQTFYSWGIGAGSGGSSDPVDMGPANSEVCVLVGVGGNFQSTADAAQILIDPPTGHYILTGKNHSSTLFSSSAQAACVPWTTFFASGGGSFTVNPPSGQFVLNSTGNADYVTQQLAGTDSFCYLVGVSGPVQPAMARSDQSALSIAPSWSPGSSGTWIGWQSIAYAVDGPATGSAACFSFSGHPHVGITPNPVTDPDLFVTTGVAPDGTSDGTSQIFVPSPSQALCALTDWEESFTIPDATHQNVDSLATQVQAPSGASPVLEVLAIHSVPVGNGPNGPFGPAGSTRCIYYDLDHP
jgi:hypothetical protein